MKLESAIPMIVRTVVRDYARAIETRDLGKLRAAYPSISSQQQDRWKGLFDSADSIRATVTFSQVRQTPTSIDAPFTLRLRMVDKQRTASTTPPIRSHALFARESDNWVLKEIR